MKKRTLTTAVSMWCFSAAGSVFAANEAAVIDLGAGISLVPSIDIETFYDDNLTNARSNEIDSSGAIGRSNWLLFADSGNNSYQASFEVESGKYFESSDDNYTDRTSKLVADLELNSRNHFLLEGEYIDGHEGRGVGFSEGFGDVLNKVDTYINKGVTGLYTYGVESAQGRVELEASSYNIDYDKRMFSNNGTPVDVTKTRDLDTTAQRVTFFYAIGAKTDLLFEAKRTDFDYDYTAPGTDNLDSTNTDYLLGITWDGTARTSGTIKIGSYQKDFDSSSSSDETTFGWDAGVSWKPRSYSTFELNTHHHLDEPYGDGDYIDTESYETAWKHSWADRLRSTLSYTYITNDYNNAPRDEDVNKLAARIDYQARRWLSWNAGFAYTEKDSNQNEFDYNKSVVTIGMQVSL